LGAISGFEIACAGKGTKYLPAHHRSTPDTVWRLRFHVGPGRRGQLQPQDVQLVSGTKSAIENGGRGQCDRTRRPENGLVFPPCGVDDLPTILGPVADGGALRGAGTVEVVSCVERDGRAVSKDLRWGVFVTFKAPSEYVRRSFSENGIRTDPSGWYGALYRQYHFIGLELGVSIASAALRRGTTGTAQDFRADVSAVAKRNLAAGETLDGEGGYTVYRRLMPARASLAGHALPIGLAHGVRFVKPVSAGEVVRWEDCSVDQSKPAVRARREMESMFRPTLGLPDGGN
jgi:predicted homoserine dehydrogenase-like protein